jgi:hypothetical protein
VVPVAIRPLCRVGPWPCRHSSGRAAWRTRQSEGSWDGGSPDAAEDTWAGRSGDDLAVGPAGRAARNETASDESGRDHVEWLRRQGVLIVNAGPRAWPPACWNPRYPSWPSWRSAGGSSADRLAPRDLSGDSGATQTPSPALPSRAVRRSCPLCVSAASTGEGQSTAAQDIGNRGAPDAWRQHGAAAPLAVALCRELCCPPAAVVVNRTSDASSRSCECPDHVLGRGPDRLGVPSLSHARTRPRWSASGTSHLVPT